MGFFEATTTVMIWIITVAIVAIVVSRKSDTIGVVQSVASGFGNSLAVAEAPVTGEHTPINLSYPSRGGGVSGFMPSNTSPSW